MHQSRQQVKKVGQNPPQQEPPDKMISRAIGVELRRAREARGWSRGSLVARLPSGIGDRTLLSYEHGTRALTVLRLVELSRELDVPAPILLSQALQRARLELTNLVLQVDLQAMLKHENSKFQPMVQWARNKLNEHPDGVVTLPPSSVRELATFVGHSYDELATYLATFTPEADDDAADTDTAGEPR